MMKKILIFSLVFAIFSLLISGCSSNPDTIPPEVHITSPHEGDQVRGIISIEATARDNRGIVKVEFYVDSLDNKIGEDYKFPFEVVWDSRNVTDGPHTLIAKATDTSNNTSPLHYVNINVDNSGPSTVEAGVVTWSESMVGTSSKVIDKIASKIKLHPKMKDVLKSVLTSPNKPNLSRYKTTNIKAVEKVIPLTSGYHICLAVWWTELSGATSYRVYINDTFILETSDLGFVEDYADQVFGLSSGNEYVIKVTGVINGVESKSTLGSWVVRPVEPVTLISPSDGGSASLYPTFSWQDPDYDPNAWEILVYNAGTTESMWYYYEQGSFRSSINYNYNGSGKALNEGQTYNWYVDYYDNWQHSEIYNEDYYFAISLSPTFRFTTEIYSIGNLYIGTTNPGKVYKYVSGKWVDLSPSPLGDTVISFAKYNGNLYVGVSNSGRGQVWRYDGGTSWTLVGDYMDGEVDSLAVYNGELYAGTSWNGMRLYKYTPGTTNCDIPNWTRVVEAGWSGTRVLYVFNNYLLMGDIGYDRFGLWDGSNFYYVLNGGGSCVYDMQEFNGKVYAAVWHGRLWETADGWNWSLTLSDGYGSRMWELEVFNGSLYMAYDNGELRRSTIPDRGELVYTAPDSIISMATDGTKLYFGTGRESTYSSDYGYGIANVYMYDGNTVTQISSDDAFGDGVQEIFVDH